jgi:hypothetical protein
MQPSRHIKQIAENMQKSIPGCTLEARLVIKVLLWLRKRFIMLLPEMSRAPHLMKHCAWSQF